MASPGQNAVFVLLQFAVWGLGLFLVVSIIVGARRAEEAATRTRRIEERLDHIEEALGLRHHT